VTLIRHRQHTTTGLFPHQANRRYILPNLAPIPSPAPNLLTEAEFPAACDAGDWQCFGSVAIDTGDGTVTMGPSFGGAERLEQPAAWLDPPTVYRITIDVVAKTPGAIPLEVRIGNDSAILTIVGLGEAFTLDAYDGGGPAEFAFRLDEDGHTIEFRNPRVQVNP